MKKQSIIFGILLTFILMAVNAFPASLRFDFDDDPNTWETDWAMDLGDTVQVDVWLEGYTGDVASVIYGFCNGKDTCDSNLDPSSILVIDAWPNDTDNGGPWSPSRSYAHLLDDGKYWYKVGSETFDDPVSVANKIKLHTIEFEMTGDYESIIGTYKILDGNELIVVLPSGATQNYQLTQTSALIHPLYDCEIKILPQTASVFTWETMQFTTTFDGNCSDPDPDPSCYTWEVSVQESTGSSISATGLYTAGENEGTDIVTVTDTCNNDISNTATVNVEMSITTTTTTSISPGTTTTTTIVEIIHDCNTSADCDDGIFCNGAEMCKFTWSSNLVGSTGDVLVKECYPGTDPCSDDGEFCNGEESCDEENDVCLNSGGPCADPTPVCDEDEDVCVGCMADEDCDDGLFCTGVEICVDNVCQEGNDPCSDDGEFCNGEESCDEEADACLSEGDPCIDTDNPVCDEEEDICIPDVPPPSIQVVPDPVSQSRWIPLPVFLNITAIEDAKFDASSSVIFTPNAIWALPLVISEVEILAIGLIMPQWLTGPLESLDVIVITGTEEAPGAFQVQLLPFFLDEDKAILE